MLATDSRPTRKRGLKARISLSALNTTSSAVKGLPSCQLTPFFNLTV
ncbi:MAG: hypothetical protein IPQ21_05280 [Betaproteobacteria bacterium]|nr:hypothetical protein [Betaproteobacteria bacterium]